MESCNKMEQSLLMKSVNMDVLGHSRILVTLPLPEDILNHIDSYNDKQLQRVVYDNFGKIWMETYGIIKIEILNLKIK